MSRRKRSPLVFARMSGKDVALIKKIYKARGEDMSTFVRRSVLKELARLGFLSDMDKKALEVRQR